MPVAATNLRMLGWNDELAAQFAAHHADDMIPGRVSVQHRGAYDVLTTLGELRCDVLGRLVHQARSSAELPAVGDWVAVAPREDERAGTIQALLPRRTAFSRKTAWHAAEEQILAANVDVVFIVTSLTEDLNLRRLERYLTLARESGARPVILLTKADLYDRPEAVIPEVAAIGRQVPIHAISSRTGYGIDALREHLRPGVTAALLGSSGVGKSTLVNTLAGERVVDTAQVRQGGKGRHTTTRRQLVLLPEGGVVIDTPGMRELQLWVSDDGLEEAFPDVTALFERCRFNDCSHTSEPDCAVREALANGSLPRERWESYVKLRGELEELERRLERRSAARTGTRSRKHS